MWQVTSRWSRYYVWAVTVHNAPRFQSRCWPTRVSLVLLTLRLLAGVWAPFWLIIADGVGERSRCTASSNNGDTDYRTRVVTRTRSDERCFSCSWTGDTGWIRQELVLYLVKVTDEGSPNTQTAIAVYDIVTTVFLSRVVWIWSPFLMW